MSLHLGDLYHWSPKRRRASILRVGLRVLHRTRDGVVRPGFPWICLATTPSSAWGLVSDPENDGADGEGGWDLWQVSVREGDELKIRGDFAPFVREVRVLHSLPADRLFWVGERGIYAHYSLGEPAAPPPPGSRRRRPRR